MRPRNARDFLAGCLFLAFGIGFLVLAQDLQIGSARRMGPAYFPVALALVLIGIGAVVAVRGLLAQTPGERMGDVAGKALVVVTAGVVVFGVLVQRAGLGFAVVGLMVVAAAASRNFRWLPTILLALALAAFSVLVFVKGLGLPFPVLGSWLGG
jgi:putative tricarboxylic transport membrane protein